MTPMKAIRAKYLDCMCGSAHEVRLCPCSDCPLYAYRFGKRPRGTGDMEEGGKRPNPQASPIVERADTTKLTTPSSGMEKPALPHMQAQLYQFTPPLDGQKGEPL